MRQKLAWLIIAVVAAAGMVGPRTGAPAPDVRAALAERYHAADLIYADELQFEQKTPLKRVNLPALARALPNVRFYTTTLRTGYFEYPRVKVAVAALKHGGIAVELSPTYSESDPQFSDIFKNARAYGTADERAVATEIARLFAIITYKGQIKNTHHVTGRFSADLWHGDLFWRRILIEFANGRLSSLMLRNPQTEHVLQPAA